jgi:hypothetical protein
MNPILGKCPVCEAPLIVTRLRCSRCETSIDGAFDPASGPFSKLSPEQVNFVLTFVRCEGRFNRMEDELKISYPTIRNRLLEIIRILGFEPGKEDLPVRLSEDERRQILDDLEQGKITFEKANQLLKNAEA